MPADPARPFASTARDGDAFVMTDGATAPARCVKCNGPARGEPRRLRLSWNPRGDDSEDAIEALISLTGIRRATVHVYVCPKHAPRPIMGVIAFVATFAICAAVGLVGGSLSKDDYARTAWVSTACGIGVFFAAVAAALVLRPPVAATRIDDGRVWLRGAGEAFLQSLPAKNPDGGSSKVPRRAGR